MGTRKGVTRLLTRHTKSCEQRGRKMFTLTAIPNIDFTELVLFLVERLPEIVAINIVLACLVKPRFRVPTLLFVPIALAIMILGTWTGSFESAAQQGYDLNEPSLRQALESYIETGDGDLNEILESGKYAPTFGQHELNYLIKDLLTHTLLHLDSHNAGNIPVAYNKGNDWFRATLGEPMVYTSGIYKHGNESLMEAQLYKLDYVANAIELKKGDSVLDIGCGWGRLVQHFSDKYGAKVMGVTLSSEQRKFGLELNKHNDAQIHLQDAMAMSERWLNMLGLGDITNSSPRCTTYWQTKESSTSKWQGSAGSGSGRIWCGASSWENMFSLAPTPLVRSVGCLLIWSVLALRSKE